MKWILLALCSSAALLCSCGGGGRVHPAALPNGHITVDSLTVELGGSRGSVLNTPRSVCWAGIAMPALARVEIYDSAVPVDELGIPAPGTTPSVAVTLAAGPDGNFFAGRSAVPVAMEIQLGGMTIYVPDEALASCRARLSSSPLDSTIVQFDLEFAFAKGSSRLTGEYSSLVSFPGTARPPAPPVYPAWEPEDTLFFEVEGRTFSPRYCASVEEIFGEEPVYTIYAFVEPFSGRPPSKVTQTCLRVRIPRDLATGSPVPAATEAFVVEGPDTLFWYCGFAYGWLEASEESGVLLGRLQFQGNGSEQAVLIRGGGRFSAPLK